MATFYGMFLWKCLQIVNSLNFVVDQYWQHGTLYETDDVESIGSRHGKAQISSEIYPRGADTNVRCLQT